MSRRRRGQLLVDLSRQWLRQLKLPITRNIDQLAELCQHCGFRYKPTGTTAYLPNDRRVIQPILTGHKGDANLFLDWVTEIDVCVCSMLRRARIAPGEIIYHALNRANGRSQLFDKFEDYAAFERIAAMRRSPIRLLAYCLMPNHWHMVLWPKKDGEMSEFLRWLTLTHSQRLHAHRHTTGYGHIYQGRFKSFPVEQDQAALNVIK